MLKAEQFKKWMSERMGHSPQLKLALEAIQELEQENSEIKASLNLIQVRGTELLNIDDIEDKEDAATIHSNFNDALLLIPQK